MSNRELCISVINSMEEWQLQSVLEMLNAIKGTMDKLEAGALETAKRFIADDVATLDDLEAIKEAANDYAHRETVSHEAINWD